MTSNGSEPSSNKGALPCHPIRLIFQGEHVPSFKNTKKIVGGKNHRPMLITDPRKRKIMDRITDAFESQLRALFPTSATAMAMASFRPPSIALSMPLDDCLAEIGKIVVDWRKVSKGQEGVEVVIERI